MSVYGLGVDIVEVVRIEDSIAKYGERFLKRVFTEGERGYCDGHVRPAVQYAARFAVKEAVAKALGTGIGEDLALLDVDVVKGDRGEPMVSISGDGARYMGEVGVKEVKVSISHSEHYAVANAIALTT